MAWVKTTWSCGHEGSMQLYGKQSYRDSRVAYEAGRQCMACGLVERWKKENDPRAKREDRYKLAADIAENKGNRIDVDKCVPVKNNDDNPLTKFATEDLLAEIERRKNAAYTLKKEGKEKITARKNGFYGTERREDGNLYPK